MASSTTNFLWNHPKPGDNLYDYSGGMQNTPDTPETLNFTKNQLPVIDTSNPQVKQAGMFPPNFWTGVGSLWGIGDMAAHKYKNWMGNYNLANQNNLGLENYITLDGTTPVINEGQLLADTNVVPQDINRPLQDTYQRSPHRGFEEMQFDETVQAPEKKGFSFNPLNWGIAGMMKRMVEPNTPEENFGRGYFNMDSSGRTYGNQAHDVFAGKNVVSAFGKGMGAAAQKRIDTINATLAKWEADPSKYGKELDEEGNIIGTTLYDKRANFNKQLAHYRKNLQASTSGKDTTGGAVTTGNVITSQGDQVNTGGGQRDTSGWSSPGYSTRGGFTGTGGSPGTGQRGHHGNWAQGGRIGYRDGEFVDEDINIEGPGFDINENIKMASGEGEEGILEQLIAKYIEAGFPPDQAEEMAMEEFQQMAMGSEQGIASLV